MMMRPLRTLTGVSLTNWNVVKINPYIDKITPDTETGVEVFVREVGRNAIGDARPVIKTGTDDTMENRTSGITGARFAYQGETENVTMKGQENFRMKVISIEKTDTPGSSLTKPVQLTDKFRWG